MKAYSNFAYVYDFLMQDVEYDNWIEYIEKIFIKYNVNPNKILDLACGTGNVTLRLACEGYDVTGVDISEEMLEKAKEKCKHTGKNVLFINQDITCMDIEDKYDAIVCLCDGINYIIDNNKLSNFFDSIYKVLNDNGILIFDISSYNKISNTLGNNTYAENFEDVSYIWENFFDLNSSICDMELTIFLKEDDYYKKYVEYHQQKAYKTDEIIERLYKYNYKQYGVFEAFTFDEPKKQSERIYFICKK